MRKRISRHAKPKLTYSSLFIGDRHMTQPVDYIFHGESLDFLKTLPENYVDLIITSPPYADNRKSTYRGVPMDQYVEWFKPYGVELLRVLKPKGSFVLNIKERAINGERHTYVLELILAMRKLGWVWVEEYIWHKTTSYPGKWPNRFRDAWERCLHFSKQRSFRMFQEEVMVPVGEWATSRLKNLSETDRRRDESKVGSGFGKNVSNWVSRDWVYPTNVLRMAGETGNRGHSASFPVGLPSWFIRLFTEREDMVLDPFLGSGTTAVAAIKLERHFIGAEREDSYYELAMKSVEQANLSLFD